MDKWRKTLIRPTTSIFDTIKIIDESALQIALVVDEGNRLAGTVTDGDIRRGILRGVPLEDPVSRIMKKNPVTISSGQKRHEIMTVMTEKKVAQVPVVDDEGRVVGLEIQGKLKGLQDADNWVVLMAGGRGTRLKPLTGDCPKPLLRVGGRPILETILNTFTEQGFRKYFLAVNYRADQIKEYFGDGTDRGIEILYLSEKERLGTAGALSLLPGKPEKPFLVMNGDLLTKVNYLQLIDFHMETDAAATMCIREHSYQLPYGVAKIDRDCLVDIVEKPVKNFFVNAGIYVLEPEILDLVPGNAHLDMTTLFKKIIRHKMPTAVFPIREYWIDVGYHQDFEKANNEYGEIFIDD